MKLVPLFFLPAIFSCAAYAADETSGSPANFSAEYISSCNGLSEKDSCQVHGKTNNLLTGTCKTKAVATGDVELVCVPEQAVKNTGGESDTNPQPDGRQHKHKRH